ncbi:hypothetical protein L6452_05018 [Arctium lappa]|uniref:Uncharacterized protein n=1 Tax=Arctium lappa TaxID=4217 RepID=A0ACB9EGA9_ARCLA|nr:hypothetical protein L6452_05018 [Arctium lappa]
MSVASIVHGFGLECDIRDELVVGDRDGWRWFPAMEMVISDGYGLDMFLMLGIRWCMEEKTKDRRRRCSKLDVRRRVI